MLLNPETVFAGAAPAFSIYYSPCSTGFSSPTWHGYPAEMLGGPGCPVAPWLVSRGFAYDTDPEQDLNGDGVTLLMAYALDLDPSSNLQSSLPKPVIHGDTLSISFFGAAEGITYSVQTSTDLKEWTMEGVTLSGIDAQGQRTATVNLGDEERFVRLLVAE